MTLDVIGTGFGRTATLSLRMALDQLDLGPCYHMETVLDDIPSRVPQWNAALTDAPDWYALYQGFSSAVDWPTAAFWQELAAYYPNAKFIHTTRDADSWADSFSQTILAILTARDKWPEDKRSWLEMAYAAVIDRQFGGRTDRDHLIATFHAQEANVKAALPPAKLLVFRATDGWEPLCDFLGKPVTSEPYPRSNSRDAFFELVGAT